MTTKSNSVEPSGEYVGNYDYFLQQGAHDDITNATYHMAH